MGGSTDDKSRIRFLQQQNQRITGKKTMQIVYHIGANCTDQDRLLKSVLKNAETFAQLGVKVPGPGKYRSLIRETIQSLDGKEPAPDTREILLDAILDDDQCDRLVMSNSRFMCVHKRVLENGIFYGLAEQKLRGLANLFPKDEIEIFLGMRNPATFIPAIFGDSAIDSFSDFMHGTDPLDLRWSDLVTRIRTILPHASLTVWCNEDTPLIWARLIRELAGVDALTKITGGFDLLSAIMSADGMRAFVTYIKANPPQTEQQKRRIIAAFLEKYALEEEVEDEIDIPGWTQDTLSQLTANYEEDIYRIERVEGVNFIGP